MTDVEHSPYNDHDTPKEAGAAWWRRLLRTLTWPFRVCFSGRFTALVPMVSGLAICWLLELAAFPIFSIWPEGWMFNVGGWLCIIGYLGGFAVATLFGLLALIGACWRDKPWVLLLTLLLLPVGLFAHFLVSYVIIFTAAGGC